MSGRRTSFYFSSKAMAELESIRRRTRHDAADLIRIAVLAYSQVLNFTHNGDQILVRDKTGEEFVYSPYLPFEYPGLQPPSSGLEPEAEEFLPKTFFFSGDVVEKIEQIVARGSVKNNSDAIRAALVAYSELIAVIAARDEIVVRSGSDQEFLFYPDAPYASQIPSRVILERTTTAHPDLVPGG